MEFSDINVIRELGVFIDGKVQGYSLRPPKKYKPKKRVFWCTRNLHEIVWNKGFLYYSVLLNNLLRDVRRENFAKGTENCTTLGNLLGKDAENLDDHGCPKYRDLGEAVKEMWFRSSYPFRHMTMLQYAKGKAKLLGKKAKQPLKLKIFRIVKCFVSIYVIESFETIQCFLRDSIISN